MLVEILRQSQEIELGDVGQLVGLNQDLAHLAILDYRSESGFKRFACSHDGYSAHIQTLFSPHITEKVSCVLRVSESTFSRFPIGLLHLDIDI